jgi:Tol biopolymer transport system component
MSPEQIQGLDSDHRSDIFSLGVVLYELFTRQLPFKGIHETALAYEIVNVDPAPMSAVNPEIEPGLDAIVLECMEKDPNERTQSAKQISVDLKRHKRESSRQKVSRITAARAIPKIGTAVGSDRTSPADGGQKAVRWLPWMIATIGLAGCAILAFMHFTERRPEVQSIHASILPPPGYTFNNSIGGHMALSPDGSMLAFVAADSVGGMSLFVRSLNSMMSRQLTESNGAQFPFWSPDSKFIGFFAQGKLKKVLASGAPPVTLCDAPSGRGGTWSQDGVILFSPNFDLIGIYRVAATGGVAVPVTHLDSTRNESNHRWPHFLPDGQHFFYTTQGSVRSAEYVGAMYVASLDGSMDKLLIKASSNMAYYNGYLLYIRQKSVVAQPLDLSKLELYGDAVPVVDKIEFSGDKSRGVFSVSANGVLTYQTPGANGGLSALYDAAGKKLLEIPDHLISNSGRFSPDGTKIVFDSPDPESNFSDIWQFDITRRINTRVTFDPSSEWLAIWSSDGGHVAYSSDKHGSGEIYVKNSDGSDAEHLIMKSPNINTTPLDWTPDGRQIIVGSLNESTNNDLVVISASGSDSIVTFANSKFNEDAARVSPDGRWLAYQSDESGRPEIYVRPFPTGNGKWQISDNGGTNPVWTGDGKTLFYNQSGGVVMAIAVTATSTTFFSGSGRKVLEISRSTVLDVSRDGKTFLVTTNVGGQTAQPISIATNWDKELSKK